MGDLIERQAAIDAMCMACGHDCDKSKFVYNAPQDEQVIMCPEHYALSTLPSAQPEQRWIPCSERLPETENGESDRVFTTCEWCDKGTYGNGRWTRILYYDGRNWCFTSGKTFENIVIAWMPLPEPYRAERRTDNANVDA